jgi:hypothetical protein
MRKMSTAESQVSIWQGAVTGPNESSRRELATSRLGSTLGDVLRNVRLLILALH